MDTLYLLQDCSIAVPSFDAENVGDALELWKMTERVVGLSWPGFNPYRQSNPAREVLVGMVMRGMRRGKSSKKIFAKQDSNEVLHRFRRFKSFNWTLSLWNLTTIPRQSELYQTIIILLLLFYKEEIIVLYPIQSLRISILMEAANRSNVFLIDPLGTLLAQAAVLQSTHAMFKQLNCNDAIFLNVRVFHVKCFSNCHNANSTTTQLNLK